MLSTGKPCYRILINRTIESSIQVKEKLGLGEKKRKQRKKRKEKKKIPNTKMTA